MKKLISLLALFIMVIINIVTQISFAQEDSASVTLVDWKTFNAKIKTLSEWKTQTYENYWNKILAIKQSNNQPWNWITKDNISLSESNPVRAWFDNGTIYIYSDAKDIYLNPDSSNMFSKFTKISDLSRLKNLKTSKVTIMDDMFAWCYWITNVSALSNWDVSNVISMKSAFAACENLKDVSWLSNRDTSGVTNMASVFHNCKRLSNITPLGNWNVKNVTNMNDMFYDCELTNISSLNNWDVSNVTNMGWMFAWSTSLTDISALNGWDVSNLTVMSEMFYSCNDLEDITPLVNWDTSKVTKMNWVFAYNKNLENISALTNWNTKKVTDLESLFRWCERLTDASALKNWDTRNVTDMSFMFEWCSRLTVIDLGNRDTSNVTEMFQMFKDCNKLKTIYVWDEFVTDKVKSNKNDIWDSSTELFDWDIELIWWNGTKYDPLHTDKIYARIDTPQAPWYFTREWSTPFASNSNWNWKSSSTTKNNNTIDTQNWYTKEMTEAYKFAYDNWITTIYSIDKAKLNSPLTRIAMAKMLSQYAINILWKKPNTSKKCKFNDVSNELDDKYNLWVTKACQLWIMWENINKFRPNDEVTRAEFATALSRMLYWTPDGNPYYMTHLKKLKQEWIITNDNPQLKEKRGYVMLMLMRTAE